MGPKTGVVCGGFRNRCEGQGRAIGRVNSVKATYAEKIKTYVT